MYVHAYDWYYTPVKMDYKKVISPYLKNTAVFYCPAVKLKPGYTLNANLAGKKEKSVKYPSETVMFYEGKNSALEYRHHDRADVSFADGHVKLLSPSEAARVRWLP